MTPQLWDGICKGVIAAVLVIALLHGWGGF
jgi:hypothetical protein